MDDELQELENELKQLRPVAPTRDLRARIETELTAKPRHRPAWFVWSALPLAAAAAWGAWMFLPGVLRDSPSRVPQGFQPVAAENLLLDVRDEGYVTLEDGSPARWIRQSYIDTIVWKNPRTNASMAWRVPREEIRVVPVEFL